MKYTCDKFKVVFEKVKDTAKELTKIAKDDPRKVTYCLKVAFTLTVLSLLIYVRPLYDGYKEAGMVSVLTVLSVLEFTVGGTLSKCLNIVLATLVGGASGVGAVYLARFCGENGEPIVMGIVVFFLVVISLLTRFLPQVKTRYETSATTFILTFTLVAISGYRVDQIWWLAYQRLATILVGAMVSVLVSIIVFPVWAGKDLHDLAVTNTEKLANFFEGFGCGEHFSFPVNESYKSVLDSSKTEDSLANFAWWECGFRGFNWEQYLKVGAYSRDCASLIKELSKLINSQLALENPLEIQQSCLKQSTELSIALKELANTMKNMNVPSSSTAETHITTYDLKSILKTSSVPVKSDLHEIVSLLVLIVKCTEQISAAVHELSRKARLKKSKSTWRLGKLKQLWLHRGVVYPVDDIGDGGDHLPKETVDIAEDSSENKPRHVDDIGKNCDHVVNETANVPQDSSKNKHDHAVIDIWDSSDRVPNETADIAQDSLENKPDHIVIDIPDSAQDPLKKENVLVFIYINFNFWHNHWKICIPSCNT